MVQKKPKRAAERAINVMLEADLYARLESRAVAEDRSVTAWVRRAIRAALDAPEK